MRVARRLKDADPGGDAPDRLGGRRAEQVPREDRLGLEEAGRPHRDRARAHGGVPREAAGGRAVGRRAEDGRAPARDRLSESRRREGGRRLSPPARRRELGRVSRPPRTRRRRPARGAGPDPKSVSTEDTFTRGPRRRRRDADDRGVHGAARRGVPRREAAPRADRDAEGAVRGLHDRDAQRHARPTRDADELAARAAALLSRTEAGARPVRLLGVGVQNLVSPGAPGPDGQLPLWND